MSRLRRTLARLRSFRKLVTLDDRDALEVIAKRARREQSRHAAADDNGVGKATGGRFVSAACGFAFCIHDCLSCFHSALVWAHDRPTDLLRGGRGTSTR